MLFLLPFYLILRNALSTRRRDHRARLDAVPEARSIGRTSRELFTTRAVNILRSLGNSAIIAVLQTAGQLLLCSMAGYGLARIPYR